ncbi:MAG: 30S ribosomal protein S20 [Pseudomonadota bacterium]|nr:30S ribosomal protein S20 [Pseudomonadota bacterium]
MANTAQARKRIRQNNKTRARKSAQKSSMRTALKAFKASAAQCLKNSSAEKPNFSHVQSVLDKSASKGLIHKGTAQRLVSRLNKKAQQVNSK